MESVKLLIVPDQVNMVAFNVSLLILSLNLELALHLKLGAEPIDMEHVSIAFQALFSIMEFVIWLDAHYNQMEYVKHVHKDTNLEEMEFAEFQIAFILFKIHA